MLAEIVFQLFSALMFLYFKKKSNQLDLILQILQGVVTLEKSIFFQNIANVTIPIQEITGVKLVHELIS